MLDRILNFIILKIFGKYSLTGFGEKDKERICRDKYIFDSIFPNDEIAKCQLKIIEDNNKKMVG